MACRFRRSDTEEKISFHQRVSTFGEKDWFSRSFKIGLYFFWNGDILTASMADRPFAIWRPYSNILNYLNSVFFLNKKKVLS